MSSDLNDTCFGTNNRCPSQSLNNQCDSTYNIATLSCGEYIYNFNRVSVLVIFDNNRRRL